jgi:hypothetical protein
MRDIFKEIKEIEQVTPNELATIFAEYYNTKHTLTLNEKVERSRYAVEVDFRTTSQEANYGFAKIALSYVSSAIKNLGFHVKLVFTEKPLRVIVSSRNWDDGEWVGMISYNDDLNMFVLSKGTFNKADKTVSVKSKEAFQNDKENPLSGKSMSEKLKSVMDNLKGMKAEPKPDIGFKLKRGPKT